MEEEKKEVFNVTKEILGVFCSRNFLFPNCMDSIVLVLDFLFSARNESEEEICRMIDDLKTALIDLKKEGIWSVKEDKKRKQEVIKKVLKHLGVEPEIKKDDLEKSRELTVRYSSKFLKELINNDVSEKETLSIISTMLAASFAVFGFDKQESERILINIFKAIHEKI